MKPEEFEVIGEAIKDRMAPIEEKINNISVPTSQEILKEIDFDSLKGEKGEAGKDAEPETVAKHIMSHDEYVKMITGNDGLGLETKQYDGSIFREGSFVTHNFGQFFKALKDTNAEPGTSEDWERVGSAGFRFTGPYDAEKQYEDGDLFVKDYGLFIHYKGESTLWVGRGPQGKRGQKGLAGKDGIDGKDGKDGSTFIGVEYKNGKIVMVTSDDSFIGDLTPILEEAAEITKAINEESQKQIPEIVKSVFEDLMWSHPSDPEGVPLRFYRGPWFADIKYYRGDLAMYAGKLYVSVKRKRN